MGRPLHAPHSRETQIGMGAFPSHAAWCVVTCTHLTQAWDGGDAHPGHSLPIVRALRAKRIPAIPCTFHFWSIAVSQPLGLESELMETFPLGFGLRKR